MHTAWKWIHEVWAIIDDEWKIIQIQYNPNEKVDPDRIFKNFKNLSLSRQIEKVILITSEELEMLHDKKN